MAGDFTIPNGIGFSPDETLMYVADSYQASIDVFDFDRVAGTISNRRRFADVERADGFPDGLCVDCEGGIWLALFGGGAVRRYSPGGEVVGQVDLPVTQVTSCAFGGEAMDVLYITTARMGDGRPLTSAELEAQPNAGDVFVVQTDVVGMVPHHFAHAHPAAGVGA
jgi:sugar lactone lactonase YvrE